VDDDVVSALEAAIADLGTLLVQMDKFRAGAGGDARDLRTACHAIGDRARRAHKHGALDVALAHELHADAVAARVALEGWLAELRASPAHRTAVAALAAGDDAALRVALLALFAGVEVVAPSPDLFHPVAWQRRGRPLPADAIAADLVRLRADGLAGDDDVAAPGVDPGLPGVIMSAAPPLGAPVYVVLRDAARPAWALRLVATGDLVVPGTRLVTPFTVGLAAPDDDDLDEWTLDPAAYHDELAAAIGARGLPLDHVS
jgi:hypothetical protein